MHDFHRLNMPISWCRMTCFLVSRHTARCVIQAGPASARRTALKAAEDVDSSHAANMKNTPIPKGSKYLLRKCLRSSLL